MTFFASGTLRAHAMLPRQSPSRLSGSTMLSATIPLASLAPSEVARRWDGGGAVGTRAKGFWLGTQVPQAAGLN